MKPFFGCALAAILLSVSAAAVDLPMSVFVVHCEPTNANEMLWSELVDLVALADRYAIPLSIDFTAQWAAMILGNDGKLSALEAWLEAGHEIGCHHHPYWATKDRQARWDGYTNTPFDEILPEDQAAHVGTMDDYMALLAALPGDRRSGCLGSDDARDLEDWPCELLYSTRGQSVADAVSQPAERAFGKCEVLEIGHALITSAKRAELRAAFESTASDQIFGVVGHVYNYRDFPIVFDQWFALLHSLDPNGERRRTVSDLLHEYR